MAYVNKAILLNIYIYIYTHTYVGRDWIYVPYYFSRVCLAEVNLLSL